MLTVSQTKLWVDFHFRDSVHAAAVFPIRWPDWVWCGQRKGWPSAPPVISGWQLLMKADRWGRASVLLHDAVKTEHCNDGWRGQIIVREAFIVSFQVQQSISTADNSAYAALCVRGSSWHLNGFKKANFIPFFCLLARHCIWTVWCQFNWWTRHYHHINCSLFIHVITQFTVSPRHKL